MGLMLPISGEFSIKDELQRTGLLEAVSIIGNRNCGFASTVALQWFLL
jgi:hypothetical protein